MSSSIPAPTFEVMDLNIDSLQAQQQHAEHLRKYEARKRARGIVVPTAVEDIKARLRDLGQPVTLFGETNVDRRDRLRDVIADLELGEEELNKLQELINRKSSSAAESSASSSSISTSIGGGSHSHQDTNQSASSGAPKHQKEAVFSAASAELVQARKEIATFSFERAHNRIQTTKKIRETEELQAKEDAQALALYEHSKEVILNTTQYGDERPLTRLRFSPNGRFVASGSLSSHVKLFDYANDMAPCGSLRGGAHTERVSSVAWSPLGSSVTNSSGANSLIATASGDGSCCLWSCAIDNQPVESDSMAVVKEESEQTPEKPAPVNVSGNVVHRLSGHKGAVLWCDFHPIGRQVATASADYSWRLWDVETATELLLQDGHSKECSSISFQVDGALAVSTDWAGVVLAWDLRSGQQIQAFQGHVKKITSSCFHPNGYQVVTGGTDNTVRIWDLRKRKCAYVLPAHCQIISDVRLSTSGELLATSSFDGTVKLWGTRDYRLLQTLTAHVGKVMSCDISPDERHVVSAGFDRTVKLWTHRSEF